MTTPEPGPFCPGVSGREQCDDCAGHYVAAPGWSVPPRILAHQPWPFEPCPHYVAPQAGDGADGPLRGSGQVKTETTVLADALLVLSREIRSDDGVANAAIAEAAKRLSDQHVEIEHLRERLATGDGEAVKIFAACHEKDHLYVLCIEPRDGGSTMRMDNLRDDKSVARMLMKFARAARA